MQKRDWNYERYRTRDRLVEYDFNVYPAVPHTAGLQMIYPWENLMLSSLSHSIFLLAQRSGYTGEEDDFWSSFSESKIHFGTLNTFPIPGEENSLYFDKETGILYYFKISTTINYEQAALADVAIVDHALVNNDGTEVFYLYIPVRAYLIEDTILNTDTSIEG